MKSSVTVKGHRYDLEFGVAELNKEPPRFPSQIGVRSLCSNKKMYVNNSNMYYEKSGFW